MRPHCESPPTCQVLLELVYESNVRFCGFEGVWMRRPDYFMSPAFAAGMVFVSSIMDRLTCQVFYNKDLLQVSGLERLTQVGLCYLYVMYVNDPQLL